MKYGFIRAHQDQFSVTRMCVVLQVSRNGYYDWRDRPESKRSKENRIALSQIREVHARSREAYGALNTWRELMARGFQWGRHRIAKLTSSRHRGKAQTAVPHHDAIAGGSGRCQESAQAAL